MNAPKTLFEAVEYFSNPDNVFQFFVTIRWPQGVQCPRCGSGKVTFLTNAKVWKCKNVHPKQKFSAKVGTIFEDSPIGLDKWLPAIWLAVNCKNGVSSYELHRALGVTQKTAWFMLHRIRLAAQSKTFNKLGGEVEVDETFIGGKARNMHSDKRAEKIHGRGPEGKTIVAAVLVASQTSQRQEELGVLPGHAGCFAAGCQLLPRILPDHFQQPVSALAGPLLVNHQRLLDQSGEEIEDAGVGC